MADDPNKRDGRDRSQVAGNQDHEVRYFAEKHNISEDEVRALIAEHGNDRETLEQAVQKLNR